MKNSSFTPYHINATAEDLAGNDGIGRYVFLPGSDGRAQEIAEHFEDVSIKSHGRGHHLYLGNLKCGDKKIAVATISSGMGCPSMEIILHELFHLGAKRFLRVGTAGSMQPEFIKIGDLINVQAAVRDESTTIDYVPISVPAIASYEMMNTVLLSAQQSHKIHTGVVHCKSSFYAREFGAGPSAQQNQTYVDTLTQCDVLATEMETATLFIQSQIYNYQLKRLGNKLEHKVLVGALLGIIAIPPHYFATAEESTGTIKNLITLAIETIKNLYRSELT